MNLIGADLIAAIDQVPASDAGLALIAAGLALLPCGRCTTAQRAELMQIRAEVDRLLADTVSARLMDKAARQREHKTIRPRRC